MREIKFRAWDKANKQMLSNHEINGDWLLTNQFKYFIPMQYTGVQDKNGKEIYEGDIIRILYTDWCSQTDYSVSPEEYKKSISMIGKVEYVGDGFRLNFGQGKYWDNDTGSLFEGKHGEKEIIGNIYENKELLNKEQEAQESDTTKLL